MRCWWWKGVLGSPRSAPDPSWIQVRPRSELLTTKGRGSPPRPPSPRPPKRRPGRRRAPDPPPRDHKASQKGSIGAPFSPRAGRRKKNGAVHRFLASLKVEIYALHRFFFSPGPEPWSLDPWSKAWLVHRYDAAIIVPLQRFRVRVLIVIKRVGRLVPIGGPVNCGLRSH